MAAAVVSYLIGRYQKNIRCYFADIITGVTFGLSLYPCILFLTGNAVRLDVGIPYVCGMGLHFTLDGFRALYGAIAAFMWLISTLFSKEYLAHYRNRNRYYLFLLLTLGATEGVFFSADFYTTFLFFEIMSFTSYVWVAQDERPESLRAAGTYLAVAVIGGLVMLMGIFLLYDVTGTLYFDDLVSAYRTYGLLGALHTDRTQLWIAGLCLLFGFGAKAGAFPLHIWLPKAHPVAPAPASALLSGILTKAGIYGILILTSYLFLGDTAWGSLILLLGVCTMVVGAVLALFSIDLKKTLACSSVSQIGFILVGVGMSGLLGEENLSAVRGSLLHMVNHSLIKLTLFLAAGVVFMNLHKLDLNAIRGFGRRKPLLHYIFLMGALGIGGVPLWNGYISKTLIHESIVEYTGLVRDGLSGGMYTVGMLCAVEWAFLISGGLTVAYMTKLYVALFWEKNKDAALQADFDALKGRYMNKASAAALTISATLLPLLGFLPHVITDRVADMGQGFLLPQADRLRTLLPAHGVITPVTYFSLENLRGALISLAIGAVVYCVVVRLWLMKAAPADGKMSDRYDVKSRSVSGSAVFAVHKKKAVKDYVDRFPKYLDLENLIYRPLLLRVLPFLCGVVCRVLDSLVDGIVVFLRKTLYKDSKLPHELAEGTQLTHMLACIASCFQWIANRTLHRRKPTAVDFDHKFAMLHDEWSENRTLIGRSMSFGLLLFCVGLLTMIGYLFVMDVF
ncbi:MAG: complex I subunit 5 family protein [Eubacterium sp.]|nr:complex I subunit 5 family protein [Eubacterium sp.]